MKVITSILLCIYIKLSEYFNGINSVDNVTLKSFISVKDCTILNTSIIAGFVQFFI